MLEPIVAGREGVIRLSERSKRTARSSSTLSRRMRTGKIDPLRPLVVTSRNSGDGPMRARTSSGGTKSVVTLRSALLCVATSGISDERGYALPRCFGQNS